MSQIAEGFLVPDRSMQEAAACIGRGDGRAMRSIFVPHAFEAFAWSGYVLVIVTEWLREQGIELPRSAAASVRSIVDKCDPLLCADKQDCETLIVNGVEDHVHALFALSRTHSIASVVKEIKRTSSGFAKEMSPTLAKFHWQGGYGAFSVCRNQTFKRLPLTSLGRRSIIASVPFRRS